METKKGLFIVLEGLDGSGKSTQAKLLAEYMRSLGRKVFETSEPTETGLGGMVRDGLGGEHPRSSAELAAMFAADRVAHNASPKSGIKRYLAEGTDVICDRYYYSSLAYQGVDGDFQWVADMNLNCPEITKPDVCVFFDLDPKKCFEHLKKGRAHFEIYEENEKIIAETRSRYNRVFELLAGRDRIVKIESSGSPEEIAAEVRKVIDGILAE